MNRRTKSEDAKSEEMVLGPSVSLPSLLDKGRQPDSTFRQLLYDISVVSTLLESAREYLAGRLGVTSPQYNIVMVVARSGGDGVSVSDVATRLNVTGAFVTNEVKKLVKGDLIVKKTNPDDGRGVLLSLTPSGYAKVRALEPDLLMVNNRLFGTLSKADFHDLARIMGSLIGVFGQTVAVLKALTTESEKAERSSVDRLESEKRKK
ncbi:DNA-binding MarR family transcriptional regulator [Variovorax boronicumulans]|uniref:MarR family winged helix-turn-helix transcriptional regulator n=1 Tax=Variovorax boronicumulans TaxID=436515 RepID=UPI0027828034|nr:MarR family winged helix-turn-helix transcriptional regulator [Variovorax boronicumulans]MDP9994027.1 DNA-binding MarR family transcriptional regulator [Variovorax boronicumulans]MDQ0005110.1 DNA-binding MarR family transcriptional regulator [Variovorax boronicumulans]